MGERYKRNDDSTIILVVGIIHGVDIDQVGQLRSRASDDLNYLLDEPKVDMMKKFRQ